MTDEGIPRCVSRRVFPIGFETPDAWAASPRSPLADGIDAISALAIVATVLGFFAGATWFLELPSHFRVQHLVVATTLAVVQAFRRRLRWTFALFAVVLIEGSSVLSVARPTPLASHGDAQPLRVVTLNVLTSNRGFDRVMRHLRSVDADLVLLLEVDESWVAALEPLGDLYPHRLVQPRADNFGIALLAKRPLDGLRVFELPGSVVPSIGGKLAWNGMEIALLGTHPLPPVGREYASSRNRQLAAIARWAAEQSGNALVLGDLNVTPFSPRFAPLLGDGHMVRAHAPWSIGATWRVDEPWFAAPIDHVLVSSSIGVVRVVVGPGVGSDHRSLQVDLRVFR